MYSYCIMKCGFILKDPEKIAAEGSYTSMYGRFKTQAFRVKVSMLAEQQTSKLPFKMNPKLNM